MSRMILFFAAAAGFFAVAFGAFAAHAMKGRFPAEVMAIFETGVRYQMFHALAALAAGFFLRAAPHPAFQAAGLFFLLGIIFFSGSLYALVFSGVRAWGAVTPLGGLMFLMGWASLALGFVRT